MKRSYEKSVPALYIVYNNHLRFQFGSMEIGESVIDIYIYWEREREIAITVMFTTRYIQAHNSSNHHQYIISDSMWCADINRLELSSGMRHHVSMISLIGTPSTTPTIRQLLSSETNQPLKWIEARRCMQLNVTSLGRRRKHKVIWLTVINKHYIKQWHATLSLHWVTGDIVDFILVYLKTCRFVGL